MHIWLVHLNIFLTTIKCHSVTVKNHSITIKRHFEFFLSHKMIILFLNTWILNAHQSNTSQIHAFQNAPKATIKCIYFKCVDLKYT